MTSKPDNHNLYCCSCENFRSQRQERTEPEGQRTIIWWNTWGN